MDYVITAAVALIAGFGLYHWVLGTAGFFGRLVQNKVEKRLKKIGAELIAGKEKKPLSRMTKYERLKLRKDTK